MLEPFFYHQALEYLKGFEKSKIKLGLSRIENALRVFGNPQNKLDVVHIAGTNGKGSVGAFLDSLLASQSKFVGRFCSPHLITPRERILIDGKPITREWFSASLSVIRDKIEQNNLDLSYFELFTLLAFYVYFFLKVDYAVIETGLGGRLDSTNVVKKPLISVITSVSEDHTEHLGQTLFSIAREKAGIIKQGVPVFTSAEGEALDLIKLECVKKSAPLYTLEKAGFKFDNGEVVLKKFNIRAKPNLDGQFQAENLGLALGVFHILTGLTGDFTDAISKTVWPARMERFELEGGRVLLVDGAHNPHALKSAVKSIPSRDFVCVFGCMKDKNVNNMLDIVLSNFSEVYLTSGDYHRFMKREDFEKQGVNIEFLPLKEAVKLPQSNKKVCVIGSLHLAGDFIKHFVEEGKFKNAVVEKEPYSFIFDNYPY